MEARIIVGGMDVSDIALLEQTRINYDSSKNITTAQITIIGPRPGAAARYDQDVYDEAVYGLDLEELQSVTIRDRRDDSKMFEGAIYSIEQKQTDAHGVEVLYVCDLNDYGSWLDRSVAWDDTFSVPMPTSDQALIKALVGKFCPQINTDHVAMLVPAIMGFEWKGKTLRQCLDDVAGLSIGEWHVDFDANLWYGAATDAPAAPYALSTEPDYETSFPVRVESYKRDFSNPVNHAYVRGAFNPVTNILAEADYADPVSIAKYGEYSYATVDDQITETYDAELKAKTTVLQNAYPAEQGSFRIWTDDLKIGQQVAIKEIALGIDGQYIIRSLSLTWKDKELVEYAAQFGAAQPNLESYLRLIDQRTRWKSLNRSSASGPPPPGSVSDISIASGGLSAGSINSVNAQSLIGSITAAQIGSVNASSLVGQVTASQVGAVNAGVIVGQITSSQIGSVAAAVIQGAITSSQIGSVAATTIQGAISAGQIGSVNATTIQGVVVTSQLADGIIDDLSKYADALRPVHIVKNSDTWPIPFPNDNFPPNSYFWYEFNGHFYRMNPDGKTYTDQGTNPDNLTGQMSFYTIGKLSATNLTGLIVAAQIQSIAATQITGAIQAAQIGSITAGQITGTLTAVQIAGVNASTIQGSITASQIASVNATAIAGSIAATQITSIQATQITGALTSTQIGSINAATITVGVIGDNQIGTLNGGKIIAGTITSAQLTTGSIDVGGGGAKPGKITVYDSTPTNIAQIGLLSTGNYGGWFKLFGAGGSDYTSAKVKTDSGGNLSINDATFTINAAPYKLYTSTTTFDSSYGSLALKVEASPDAAALVSRGIVIYYSSSNVAALVRSPSGGWGELTLSGGSYVFASGQTGVVRADGGFAVSSSTGVTETVNVGGVNLRFVGGIYVGH